MSEKAYFGGGCFWCTEYECKLVPGVTGTQVGYMGGDTDNPTYRDVCTGKTGHAEVVEVTFDPDKISYEELVRFFLTEAHDPTQKNRQGVDVGTQYRSAVFYTDEEQKKTAEKVINDLNNEKRFPSPVVTEVTQAARFWPAEEYHQDYYDKFEAETGREHLNVTIKQQKRR